VRGFGGDGVVTTELLNGCLNRMRSWWKVTKAVLRAEFPMWESVIAFSALNLVQQRKILRSTATVADEASSLDEKHIRRLALLLDLNKDQLVRELRDHRPIARNIYVSTGCSAQHAWATAVLRTQKHSGTKGRHPAEALRRLIWAFSCMGASSSSVEQGFSKAMKNISKQSSSSTSTTQLEFHLTKIIVEKAHTSDAEEKEIIQLARVVWADNFNPARICHAIT
jgi:hypothetical protein